VAPAIIRDKVEHWPPSDKKVTCPFCSSASCRVTRWTVWRGMFFGIPVLRRISPASVSHRTHAVDGAEGETLLDRIQHYDLERSLAEGLLTKADRASMHSALELRAPFLDQAVMEFAAHCSRQIGSRASRPRYFSSTTHALPAQGDRLPQEARAVGAFEPLAPRRAPASLVEDALSRPVLDQIGINRSVVRELMNEHLHRQADHGRALWGLVVVSEWLAWLSELAEWR